jgi:hypothetical protein
MPLGSIAPRQPQQQGYSAVTPSASRREVPIYPPASFMNDGANVGAVEALEGRHPERPCFYQRAEGSPLQRHCPWSDSRRYPGLKTHPPCQSHRGKAALKRRVNGKKRKGASAPVLASTNRDYSPPNQHQSQTQSRNEKIREQRRSPRFLHQDRGHEKQCSH